MVVTAGADVIDEIAAQPGVAQISPDRTLSIPGPALPAARGTADQQRVQALAWNITRIRANQVWAVDAQGAVVGEGYPVTDAVFASRCHTGNAQPSKAQLDACGQELGLHDVVESTRRPLLAPPTPGVRPLPRRYRRPRGRRLPPDPTPPRLTAGTSGSRRQADDGELELVDAADDLDEPVEVDGFGNVGVGVEVVAAKD